MEKGLDVRPRSYNFGQKPDRTLEGIPPEYHVYSYDLRNLPAYPDESWMPPRSAVIPRIVVGALIGGTSERGWQGFAVFCNDSLPNFRKQPAEVKDLALSLMTETATEPERITRIATYVGTNVRYVAIDVGESGLLPQRPTAVLENRHGDCKDMSVLAVVLLRLADVEAYPALLRTRNTGEIDQAVFAPRFNHMIVYIETSEGGEI